MHYIIGIDEAGRGPWAGPIVVGGFMIRGDMREVMSERLPGLTDSKQLDAKKRDSLFTTIEYMQSIGECQYGFAYRDASAIDEMGIREANRLCMQDVILSFLSYVGEKDTVEVFIDGCDNYRFECIDTDYMFAKKRKKTDTEKRNDHSWETRIPLDTKRDATNGEGQKITLSYVIGGDESIPIISTASIVAKVLRDRMMCDFSVEHPDYGFSEHKGYGTRKHHDAIINYGITPIHRKSYEPMKSLILQESSV